MAKRFKFDFESVLRVKKLRENLQMKEFSDAQKNLIREAERVGALMDQEDAGKDVLKSMIEKQIDVQELRLQKQYLYGLSRKISAGQTEMNRLAGVLEMERGKLVMATQARKIMDRLKERHREDYVYESDRAEQKTLDEIKSKLPRMKVV